jgi:hypothetical protein
MFMDMVVVPTFVVKARYKFPSTGYQVNAGGKVVVIWLSGEWSANPAWGELFNGNGNPAYPQAKPGYAMPGVPEGSLVGMVNNQVFFIGNRGVVPQNLTGTLQLSINDDLDGRYGPGYTDNIGELKVIIFKES